MQAWAVDKCLFKFPELYELLEEKQELQQWENTPNFITIKGSEKVWSQDYVHYVTYSHNDCCQWKKVK